MVLPYYKTQIWFPGSLTANWFPRSLIFLNNHFAKKGLFCHSIWQHCLLDIEYERILRSNFHLNGWSAFCNRLFRKPLLTWLEGHIVLRSSVKFEMLTSKLWWEYGSVAGFWACYFIIEQVKTISFRLWILHDARAPNCTFLWVPRVASLLY